MRKFYLILCVINLIWLQTGLALIKPNESHPFHFVKKVGSTGDEDDFEPFYLLSKSAYQLLNTEDFPNESDWHQIIDFAHAQGFNSVRIWMIWANYVPGEETACNDFKAWPWETPSCFDGDWYKIFSTA